MAAGKDIGLEELLSLIDKVLQQGAKEYTLLIPYSNGNDIAYINNNCQVLSTEYLEEGTKLVTSLSKKDAAKFKEYIVD